MEAKREYRTGIADRMRAVCKLSEPFSRRDLYYRMDDASPLNSKELKSFKRTWDDLRKRGEIVRAEFPLGKYIYNPSAAPVSGVRNRIYRAMHVQGAFCAADIKKLTDADQSYISLLIRKLEKDGMLEMTGKSEKKQIFRVRNSNKFYLEMIHENR